MPSLKSAGSAQSCLTESCHGDLGDMRLSLALQHRIRAGRQRLVQVWCTAVLLSAIPDCGWSQTPVLLKFVDGCASCRLTASEHRFSGEAGDLGLTETLFSSVTDSRRLIWLSFTSASRVTVVDSLGALQGFVGRHGEGPGEFLAPGALIKVADSVLVFDLGLGRMTVVGPDLMPTRSIRLMGQVIGGVALEWPRIVINAVILTAPSVGRPYHILNIATGEIEKSFGGRGGGNFLPGDVPLLLGHVSAATDGQGVWTLQRARFILQRWAPDGRLQQTYTVSREWFPDEGRAGLGTRDVPPDPVCVGLHPLRDGRLLVFVLLPRPDWKGAWGRVPASADPHHGLQSLPAPESIRESYVLLVDPTKGEIVKQWPADVFPVGLSHGGTAMIEVAGRDSLIPIVVNRSFNVVESQRAPRSPRHTLPHGGSR